MTQTQTRMQEVWKWESDVIWRKKEKCGWCGLSEAVSVRGAPYMLRPALGPVVEWVLVGTVSGAKGVRPTCIEYFACIDATGRDDSVVEMRS